MSTLQPRRRCREILNRITDVPTTGNRFGNSPILLAAVFALLASVSCSWSTGKASIAPQATAGVQRPAWLKRGVVMVGSWETPTFQLRRGGQEASAAEIWKLERTERSVRKLKELGINLVITNLHRGFGLKTEAEEVEATRRFTKLAHQYGLKVGGYVGASMMYETFFSEEPDAHNWIQVDEWGHPIYYNDDQTFRYMACRNNPGYRAFVKKVLRLGVEDLKLDLIHFDQMQWWAEPLSCRCQFCQSEFRAFLAALYTEPQRKMRFGFTSLDNLRPPPFNAPARLLRLTELHNPLMQDWARFRAANLATRFAEYDDYIRRMNPEVAVEGNPNINLACNLGFSTGVDYSQLLQHGDIFWSEEPNHAAWTADGRLVSKIRSFKVARTMGKSLFMYTGGRYASQNQKSPPELRLAEAIAYNGANLGMVGDLSADGTDLTEAARRYVRFFQKHIKDLTETASVANVAVLRSFPSIEYNPAKSNVSTVLFEQTLIESKIPFDIIFEAQLRNLTKYKVVVLANQDALSDAEADLIRSFVRKGGGLVATEDSSLLSDWRLRRPRFALADVFGLDVPPKPGVVNEAQIAGFVDPDLDTPAQRGVPNQPVRRVFGSGRVVYVPRIEPSVAPPLPQINYNFSNDYWKLPKNYRELVSAVNWVSNDELPTAVEAPLSVALELDEQKTSNTWLLHLINYDFTHPVRNIAVRMRVPFDARVQEAIVESPDDGARRAIGVNTRDGLVSFQVPFLHVYDLVRMKLENNSRQ